MKLNKLIISSKISDLSFIQKIIFKVHRLLRKSIIDSRKNMLKDERIPHSLYEEDAIVTVRNAVRNPYSVLTMKRDGKMYIENEREQIDVIISNIDVDIIYNGIPFNVPICTKTHSKITNIFDGYLNGVRDKKEEIMRSKVRYSIQSINLKLLNK